MYSAMHIYCAFTRPASTIAIGWVSVGQARSSPNSTWPGGLQSLSLTALAMMTVGSAGYLGSAPALAAG
jgi:hypothetical protein